MNGSALPAIDALHSRNAISKVPRAAGYRGSDFVHWHRPEIRAAAAGVGELIVGACTADGQRLINNPIIARYFARMAMRSERYLEEEAVIDGNEVAELEDLMNHDIDEFRYR